MPANHPSSEEIRDSLARLRVEPELARSQQLVDFLEYVVEKSLIGKQTELKAYTIATDVFGRDASFDPQTDSIVRVQAGRLRKALDIVYRRGVPGASVRIVLPVGRYVPGFEWVKNSEIVPDSSNRFESDSVAEQVNTGKPRHAHMSRAVAVRAAVVATLVVVVLLAAWWALWPGRVAEIVSERPVIIVSPFEAADATAAADARVFAALLVERLSAFDGLDIHLASPGWQTNTVAGDTVYHLAGAVALSGQSIEVRTIVTRARGTEVIWSHGFSRVSVGETHEETLRQLADRVAANIGTARGTVQSDARARLPDTDFTGGSATEYACSLLFRDALGPGREEETKTARGCYRGLISADEDNIVAKAALGVLDGLDAGRVAAPGDDLADLLQTAVAAGADVVRAFPASSFAHELYGRILLAVGDTSGAEVQFLSALARNSENSDAEAALGIMTALMGERRGQHHVERAIACSLWPAGWYYTIRAIDGLRRADYAAAVHYALTIMPDDAELGLAILVAAAPGAARSDLLDANVKALLALPQFKAQGILPRLSVRIADQRLLEILRIGLIRAGITTDQLDRPYLS